MLSQIKNDEDRRVKRTKALVFDAFFEMVQSTRYDEFKTKHIIEKAGIGRSTFYEHFLDKDDVLSQSLKLPMSIYAAALTGNKNPDNIVKVLEHFWERRLFARIILKHPTREVVDSCLRTLILTNMNDTNMGNHKDRHAHASFLSSGFLSLLNEWLTGRLSFSPDEMCNCIETYSQRTQRCSVL